MSLRLCVLGSGSTGNCLFLSGGNTNILIDQGLPLKRVERCLEVLRVDPKSVALLVTHTHSDHISGVAPFAEKYGSEVYCSAFVRSALAARTKNARVKPFLTGDFFVGDLTVAPFEVPHDVPCVGYSVYHAGKKVSIATDLGQMPAALVSALGDSELILIESNHDTALLASNRHYPPYLKRRILSGHGHLSNDACADCLVEFAKSGVRQIVLGHLSKENNYPELAFETAKRRLSRDGFYEGRDIRVDVAAPDRMSALFEVS
ncbi:MAG: MBL fold metallo-hydrolase [Clostridiales bacterium]|jgi:phosphoribosyl 1,2-cyclic phosphodiesterase|nr:MBL fold metallo-hydrolase [Clostridiales bacterium]